MWSCTAVGLGTTGLSITDRCMAAGKVRQPLCPAVVTRGDVMSLFGQKLFTTFLCV